MRIESIFHIFRNTPYGGDAFAQRAEFAKKAKVKNTIYIPRHASETVSDSAEVSSSVSPSVVVDVAVSSVF